MSELGFSVEGVLDALAAQPHRGSGGGRAIMFVAGQRKQGVTHVARAVANAAGAGSIYAIDLDLKRNSLAKALSQDGALGPKIDGRLGEVSFYGLRSAGNSPMRESKQAFTYHRVGRSRVYAGVFDARALPTGARVVVSPAPDYWNAVRAGGASVVVDAPSFDRSQIGLRVAPHMDGVVLVVGADRGAAPAAMKAKAALEAAGANIIGLVYSGATGPVMAIEKLMRQLG